MIDLSYWNLTTPEVTSTGGAVTYWPELPTSSYFSILGNGDLALWAPTKGATTTNSERTRTEFREIVPGTKTLKNWQLGEFLSQYLRVAMSLQQTTPNGRVVVAQIHVKDISRPMLKILWDNGSLRARIRQHCNQVSDPEFVLLEGIPLGERISFSVGVSQGGVISINLAHGARRGECRFNMLPSYVGRLLYFKAGLYNQEDATDLTPADAGSRAIIHKLETERT
ncbi:polysaccharide lyase family 7 protein [Azotobacter salinestris]|uniref:polysaccharide lyase family 7 protein n=1 Tax=Azotobacter salinestris TaxID=69964 RepID=UPI0032E006B1